MRAIELARKYIMDTVTDEEMEEVFWDFSHAEYLAFWHYVNDHSPRVV